jgi:hypothetical protein
VILLIWHLKRRRNERERQAEEKRDSDEKTRPHDAAKKIIPGRIADQRIRAWHGFILLAESYFRDETGNTSGGVARYRRASRILDNMAFLD